MHIGQKCSQSQTYLKEYRKRTSCVSGAILVTANFFLACWYHNCNFYTWTSHYINEGNNLLERISLPITCTCVTRIVHLAEMASFLLIVNGAWKSLTREIRYLRQCRYRCFHCSVRSRVCSSVHLTINRQLAAS